MAIKYVKTPSTMWTEFLNLNDKRFAPYRRLRKSALDITVGPGHFVAESHKVVQQLLRSKLTLHSLLGTSEQLLKLKDEILESGLSEDQIFCVPIEAMESIVGMSLHQGIMAIAQRPKDQPLESLSPQIIVLNGVVNPENVGSIIRSAAGFGFDSIVFDNHSSDPFVRRSVRVSMGNAFHMKTHRTRDLAETINDLKKMNYTIIGSDFRQCTDLLGNFKFPHQYALVVGSEVHGMDQKTLASCDSILKIPTHVPLNASHAATTLFFEAKRNICIH